MRFGAGSAREWGGVKCRVSGGALSEAVSGDGASAAVSGVERAETVVGDIRAAGEPGNRADAAASQSLWQSGNLAFWNLANWQTVTGRL